MSGNRRIHEVQALCPCGYDPGRSCHPDRKIHRSHADRQHSPAALQYCGQRDRGTLRGRQRPGRRRQRRAHPEPDAGAFHRHFRGRLHRGVTVLRRQAEGVPLQIHRGLRGPDRHRIPDHHGRGSPCHHAPPAAPPDSGEHYLLVQELPDHHLYRHCGRRLLQHPFRRPERPGGFHVGPPLPSGGHLHQHLSGLDLRGFPWHGRGGRCPGHGHPSSFPPSCPCAG